MYYMTSFTASDKVTHTASEIHTVMLDCAFRIWYTWNVEYNSTCASPTDGISDLTTITEAHDLSGFACISWWIILQAKTFVSNMYLIMQCNSWKASKFAPSFIFNRSQFTLAILDSVSQDNLSSYITIKNFAVPGILWLASSLLDCQFLFQTFDQVGLS